MTVTVLRRRRGRQRTRQAQETQEQLRVVLEALAQVGTWALAVWQTRGDEPEDPDVDDAFAGRVAAVKSKVVCLREAYPALGWTDLADDLSGLDDDTRALEALVRLQRYHGPLCRVRAAGTSRTREGQVATAREVGAGLEALMAHCTAQNDYNPENYQTEDTILAGLVGAVRELARECGVTTIANRLAAITITAGQAPQARDRMILVVLPQCQSAYRQWCGERRSRGGGEARDRPQATGSAVGAPDIVMAGGKFLMGPDYTWVEQGRPKKRWRKLPLNTQLALRVLCEQCRGRENAKGKQGVLAAVNELRVGRGKTPIDINTAVSHLFRRSVKGGSKVLLPFYKKVVKIEIGDLYWIDASGRV